MLILLWFAGDDRGVRLAGGRGAGSRGPTGVPAGARGSDGGTLGAVRSGGEPEELGARGDALIPRR